MNLEELLKKEEHEILNVLTEAIDKLDENIKGDIGFDIMHPSLKPYLEKLLTLWNKKDEEVTETVEDEVTAIKTDAETVVNETAAKTDEVVAKADETLTKDINNTATKADDAISAV